ncbi:MAG: sugar ABC transporter substrate-binding protein [Spirochaetaceae bacterium]|nr:sugar ABC transporter substrate-binding protein [Spirochaetaceae bacterium]
MARRPVIVTTLIPALLIAGAVAALATGEMETPKTGVTFFWALYDGLTEEYRAELQDAFNAAHGDVEVEIVAIQWEQLHDRLTTSLAGGKPPEVSVIGTRWLLEFMALDAVEEVTQYVRKATIDNIAPGAMEARVGGRLMGLPIAAGARILAYNPNLTSVVPQTMEELRTEAMRVTADTDAYGLIMPGRKFNELTDFAHYLLAAGGYFFETLPDGSYGASTVNSPEGVKALEFMVKLANEDQVVQQGYLALDRKESHPIFYTGNAGYVFIGAWVESAMNQAGADFQAQYAQIPGFAGRPSTPLIITDSVAMFSGTNLEAAGKFLDFFYQDEWKATFDELVGFPPVTISAGMLPQFQSPLYRALGEAALNARGWPLMDGWAEYSDIIWNAVQKAFLKQMTPQEALDEAAAKIDGLRGM